MIRRRVVASGHVQGVFFRDATRRRAGELGVAGWARNRDDGNVEVVLEGDSERVEAVVRFIREGPGKSDVHDLEVTEEEPEGLSGFETA